MSSRLLFTMEGAGEHMQSKGHCEAQMMMGAHATRTRLAYSWQVLASVCAPWRGQIPIELLLCGMQSGVHDAWCVRAVCCKTAL